MVFSMIWFHLVLLNCSPFITAFAQSSTPARVLIYSATRRFRHDAIPTAIQVLKTKGPSINVDFENTEDEAQFTDQILVKYDALLFLSNTGEVLGEAGKTAFQKYLNIGGNFIGIHSATDCLVNTTFYGREIGAYFDYHADLQMATVNVIGPSHPSTSMLPSRWQVQDEMYNFKSDPRVIGATVILSADESSYIDNGTRKFDQGTPHPIAWFQEQGAGVQSGGTAGRSFYTSLGHLNETWQDDIFMSHVLGGISWVLQANTTKAFNSSATVGNMPGSSNTGSNPTISVPVATSQSTPSPSAAMLSTSKISTFTVVLTIAGTAFLYMFT